LLKARNKTQLFSAGLEIADGMVKTTLKLLGSDLLLLDSIRFVSEHLELLEQRATTSAGKPESTLCGIAKKCRPSFSFLLVCSVLV